MNAEEYSIRAKKHWAEKNFDGVIADYSEVIKLESDNTAAYLTRGMSYVQKKSLIWQLRTLVRQSVLNQTNPALSMNAAWFIF